MDTHKWYKLKKNLVHQKVDSHILRFPESFLSFHLQVLLAGGLLISDETVRASDIKMEFRISDPERGVCEFG